ncbi:MAG: hypothetical protein NZ585_01660 [Chloracidobacterium sp.]|nr:hypothetical protein [Chloracidobacterium sp.]MDW8216287.1 hypothetical protein [Acidobacteriota bacterium]
MEFGIATVVEHSGGHLETLTVAGLVVGTPASIAPGRVVGKGYGGRTGTPWASALR